MMLIGAYVGFWVALETGSTWFGLAAGAVAGLLTSVLMVVFSVRLKLDQIVIGIAIVLLAEGLTSLVADAQFGESRPRLENPSVLALPLLSNIPVLGESAFSQHPVVYLGVIFVFVVQWMLRRTTMGLNIRAAGEAPAALDAAGVSVVTTRSLAVLSTGALAGLGGGYLAAIGAGTFTPFMTQGAGFIAIVIAMLARGKAPWTIIGALMFGGSLSTATALQLVGVDIPTDYVQMLPFIVVIVVLVIVGRRSVLPSALAIPYVRGER
jgi:simple sugar transport system permease protein